jgi:hypothetical protein
LEVDRGAVANLSGENTIDTADNANTGWSAESVFINNGGTLNVLAGSNYDFKNQQ